MFFFFFFLLNLTRENMDFKLESICWFSYLIWRRRIWILNWKYLSIFGLNVCSFIFIYVLKLKIGSIFHIYKSSICSCIKYCFHILSGSAAMYLKIIDKSPKMVCNFIDPDLVSRLQSRSHRRDVDSVWLFYKCFHGNYSNVLFGKWTISI